MPSEIQSADFYRMASDMLREAGYNHYEISSYCKDGFECEHNLTYWRNKAFYGFGLGSASYIKGMRFSRPRKMKEYAEYVQNLENGVVDCCGNGHVDAKDLAMDVVMLSLRTARGLELKSFEEAFGCSLVNSICEAFKLYVESGHVVCLDEQRTNVSADQFSSLLSSEGKITQGIAYIRFGDPDGFLLSNELISLAFGAIAP